MYSQNFFWTEASEKRNFLTEKYEPIQPLLLKELFNFYNCNIFFDIGANIGFYSVMLSAIKDIEIFSFEANKCAFDHLSANIKLNNIQKISCYNKAVSSNNGEVLFNIESDLSGRNSVEATSCYNTSIYKDSEYVKSISIDSLFSNINKKRVALKIDVEGHELEVIKGARNLLMNNNCLIQVEIFEKNINQMRALLYDIGYTQYTFLDNDYYFTNFKYCPEYKFFMQNVLKIFIENSIFPSKKNNNFLTVNYNIDDDFLNIDIYLKNNIIENPEYCIYLYSGKNIIYKSSYQSKTNYQINIHTDIDWVNLNDFTYTIFCRNKNNILIKIKQSGKISKLPQKVRTAFESL